MEHATLKWASWFDHHRLLEPIGYISPAEAEEYYYRQLANQATAVMTGLKPTNLLEARGDGKFRSYCNNNDLSDLPNAKRPPGAIPRGLLIFGR